MGVFKDYVDISSQVDGDNGAPLDIGLTPSQLTLLQLAATAVQPNQLGNAAYANIGTAPGNVADGAAAAVTSNIATGLASEFSTLTNLGSQTVLSFGATSFSVDANGALQALNPGYPPDASTIIVNPQGQLAQVGSQVNTYPFGGPLNSTFSVVGVNNATNQGVRFRLQDLQSFPAIELDAIGTIALNSPFSLTGTLTNYPAPLAMSFIDDGGAPQSFASNSGTVTVNGGVGSYSVTHPGQSLAGTHVCTVQDSNGVSASQTYVASANVATSGTITNLSATTVKAGSAVTFTLTFLPAGTQGYIQERNLTTGSAEGPVIGPLPSGSTSFTFTSADIGDQVNIQLPSGPKGTAKIGPASSTITVTA